jgi:hypothetical protein
MIETDYEGWKYLRKSDKQHLKNRADCFAQKMWKYKIVLAAMDYLVPTEQMRKRVKEVRQKVESSFGSANPFEIASACGLFLTGRLREFRNRHWGDVLQPPTQVTHYNDGL